MSLAKSTKKNHLILTIVLAILAALFLSPILIVVMNSFKSKLFISNEPFSLPNPDTFSGGENYITDRRRSSSSTLSDTLCSSPSFPYWAFRW